MSTITIYHNPNCGTSRKALETIRESGTEPRVIRYLDNPPDRDTLRQLIAAMGLPARAMMRRKNTPYEELDLDDPRWSEEQLIGFMLEHPALIERPIVVTPLGTRLCRPLEKLREILPKA